MQMFWQVLSCNVLDLFHKYMLPSVQSRHTHVLVHLDALPFHHILQMLKWCYAELPQPGPGDWIHEITKGGSMWVPKNTKVRATFREVLHNVHGFELPEASDEENSSKICNADGVTDTAASGKTGLAGTTCQPEGQSRCI
jgi:hypothetical protein